MALICCILGDAAITGYPVRNGLAHGLFFGSFAGGFLWGFFLAVGELIRILFTRFLSIPRYLELSIRYYLHVPVSLFFICSSFNTYSNDGFEKHIADTRPISLKIDMRDVRSGFGTRYWMFAFSVDPKDVDIITSTYDYQRREVSKDEIDWEREVKSYGYHGLTIPKEYEMCSQVLSYHMPNADSEYSGGFDQTIYYAPLTGRFLVFGSDD